MKNTVKEEKSRSNNKLEKGIKRPKIENGKGRNNQEENVKEREGE